MKKLGAGTLAVVVLAGVVLVGIVSSESPLSAETEIALNHTLAAIPVGERAAFTNAVHKVEGKLTPSYRAGFVSALRRQGYSAPDAQVLGNSAYTPIAMVTIPVTSVRTVNHQPPDATLTSVPAGWVAACGSTAPYMQEEWDGYFGNMLATTRWQTPWCWAFGMSPSCPWIICLPHWDIIDWWYPRPHYNYPSNNTSAWCLQCEFYLDNHDERFFAFSDAYHIGDPHSAFHEDLHFHWHQCIGSGIPLVGNICSNKWGNWALEVRANGTFSAWG